MKVSIAVLVTLLMVGAVALLLRFNAPLPTPKTISFSSYTVLTSSWDKYKLRFLNQDGRVIDHSNNGLTTSEGQSYAMLRAVWIDDKPTFDQVWKWTFENLKREDDQLFGWKWGQRTDDSYGFLEDGGGNSASDADQDVALALILAARRWRQQSYLEAALPILYDIWDKETLEVKGKRFLTAGNWAVDGDKVTLNPSYFAPYAWRIFGTVDTSHPWTDLVEPAYEVLTMASSNPLDTKRSAQLPPDWVVLDTRSGSYSVSATPNLTSKYSFDAMRVPWRVALDFQWYQTPQAERYLSTHFQRLAQEFQTQGVLAGSYTHDGQRVFEGEHGAMYGTAIGYFLVANPQLASQMYEQKLLSYYSNDTNSLRNDVDYYAQNWIWFGIGLYNKYLSNFGL